MFDAKKIDNLASRLAEVIPSSFNLYAVREDMKNNFRAILQSVLGKMDLVTREEFAVQKAVLAKTRQKIEALESLISTLESKAKIP